MTDATTDAEIAELVASADAMLADYPRGHDLPPSAWTIIERMALALTHLAEELDARLSPEELAHRERQHAAERDALRKERDELWKDNGDTANALGKSMHRALKAEARADELGAKLAELQAVLRQVASPGITLTKMLKADAGGDIPDARQVMVCLPTKDGFTEPRFTGVSVGDFERAAAAAWPLNQETKA